jgi:hypothetical protein
VYAVPNPSAHIIMRIRKLAQSMPQLLSVEILPPMLRSQWNGLPLALHALSVVRYTFHALHLEDRCSKSRPLFGALKLAGGFLPPLAT